MSRQRQQSARVSWQEQNKEARAEFLEANSWQRETIETKVDSQDGFLVLIGLFVVLVLENLWQFDADVFASSMRLEVFLALLVCGAACGVFAIFSMTMIRLKLQQLVARDIAALRSLQVVGHDTGSRLDRLADQWEASSAVQYAPACISYEWYYGGGVQGRRWHPGCPSALNMYATISFAVTVMCSMAALAIRLADTKGLGWGLGASAFIGVGAFVPVLLLRASTDAPAGVKAYDNPFRSK